jgi:hypothetical protein
MDSNDNGTNRIPRRNLLACAASGAAALSLGSLASAQTAGDKSVLSVLPANFASLARLRSYRPGRASSYDRSGGNNDFLVIEPGQTTTLLETSGAGTITHIWFTINSAEDFHLKKLVLRAYWDGEAEPSVEVPVGDFFGLGLGDYFSYQSALTSVASIHALNAYFSMPYRKSARLTVTNDGVTKTSAFYYNIDYVSLAGLPTDIAYFHAQYRQANPNRGWTDNWNTDYEPQIEEKKNLSGEGNYVFLEARGQGHYIGVTHAVLQNQDGWWGEGDEMIFIDDDIKPAITGTGTEDFYNGAWNFGGLLFGTQPFGYLHNGAPYIVNAERVGGRYCLYRWHLESPLAFQHSIKVTLEHGHANHRSDSWFSAAFWYQTEPHAKFPALPKVDARIPRIVRVGGPGQMPLPSE